MLILIFEFDELHWFKNDTWVLSISDEHFSAVCQNSLVGVLLILKTIFSDNDILTSWAEQSHTMGQFTGAHYLNYKSMSRLI